MEAPAPVADVDGEKRRAALLSVLASGGLAAAKLLAGVLTGSLGLLSEAAHSLLDLGATAITYWAIRVAERPADTRHRYGHAKVESVAALIATGLLFLTAAGVVTESVHRLWSGHTAIEVPWWAFVLMLVSIAVDFTRSRSLHEVAQRTSSAALEADALHFTSDMASSLAVLAGLALVAFGVRAGDALAALAVAAFIVLAGYRLGQRTIDALMDAAPEGAIERIEAAGKATEGVLWLERVRARPAGPTLFVEATVAVPRTLPLDRASALRTALAEAIRRELPGADSSLTLQPVELDSETAFDKVMLIAARRGLAVHHVTVQHIDGRLAVSLDLEVDGQLPLSEAHAVATGLEDAIESELGSAVEVESHIEPMMVSELAGTDVPEEKRARIAAVLTELAAESGRLTGIHDVRARTTPLGLLVTVHCQADPQDSVQVVHQAVEDLERRFQEHMPEVKRLIGHAEPLIPPV